MLPGLVCPVSANAQKWVPRAHDSEPPPEDLVESNHSSTPQSVPKMMSTLRRINALNFRMCQSALILCRKPGLVDSSSKCNNASSRPATRCQETSHGKDGKQRAFPTFPRHGYGYLYESIHEICCTWNLSVPLRTFREREKCTRQTLRPFEAQSLLSNGSREGSPTPSDGLRSCL